MKKRKFLALLLTAAMAVSMAACGGKEPEGSSEGSQGTEGTESTEGSGAEGGEVASGEDEYTYNIAFTASPTNWNPHVYETSTDGDYMLSYLSDGFYVFDYNEDKTGYALVPGMTTAEPTDVTDQYEIGRAHV